MVTRGRKLWLPEDGNYGFQRVETMVTREGKLRSPKIRIEISKLQVGKHTLKPVPFDIITPIQHIYPHRAIKLYLHLQCSTNLVFKYVYAIFIFLNALISSCLLIGRE